MSERFLRSDSNPSLNDSDSDFQRDSIIENKIPKKLRRTLIFCILFVLIGIGLLITGIIHAGLYDDIQSSFPFWILSLLCLIPGVYYSIQFIRAKFEKNISYRREIIDDIPEL